MSIIIDLREWLMESLKDPAKAAAYLNEALKLGDAEVFLDAICDVIDARNEWIENRVEPPRFVSENECKILSKEPHPELEGIQVLLDALGIRMVIEKKKRSPKSLH